MHDDERPEVMAMASHVSEAIALAEQAEWERSEWRGLLADARANRDEASALMAEAEASYRRALASYARACGDVRAARARVGELNDRLREDMGLGGEERGGDGVQRTDDVPGAG